MIHLHLIKTRIVATFAAVASLFMLSSGIANASAFDPQDFANDKVKTADWSAAEAALLGVDVAEEDKVFAKLNLAFVYSSTGRQDMAIAMYNEVLENKENPYALTASGKPRRVKSIAKLALASLVTE